MRVANRRPAVNGAERAVSVRSRRATEARTRTRRRRRRIALAVVAVLLAPVLYSYVSTMMMPSSLPLGVRSVEWLRTHHGAWLVDEIERFYYCLLYTSPSPRDRG